MNCSTLQDLMHPFIDGELDVVRHVEIEEHLKDCESCAEQERQLRSLRATIASASLGYPAPAALCEKIRSAVAAPSIARTDFDTAAARTRHARRRSTLQFAAIAAGLLLLVGGSAVVGSLFSKGGASADDRLAEAVIAGHVRSLQADHLFDVASTDRHTVKPWFKGKIDFSPEIPDLASDGFPLSGGRLDYLVDRPVAALVYSRAMHTINLFIWPAADRKDKPVRSHARQGFHLRNWQKSGMTYWAVTDLNEQELDDFVRLFQEHAVSGQP
ncbi:MAG TPA: anti-sigma factor [Pirellulales bacterium]|nr:anti-sigma factor [Pirellulales bacterium]